MSNIPDGLRYSAEQKLQLVEETMVPGMTVSAVARLHGVSPSLLFQWRRRMSEGGKAAIQLAHPAGCDHVIVGLDCCFATL